MSRAEVPDEYLELDGASWERAVEFREEVIRLQLLKLKQKIESYFKTGVQADYRLVFQSKMHLIDEEEQSTITESGFNFPANLANEARDTSAPEGKSSNTDIPISASGSSRA